MTQPEGFLVFKEPFGKQLIIDSLAYDIEDGFVRVVATGEQIETGAGKLVVLAPEIAMKQFSVGPGNTPAVGISCPRHVVVRLRAPGEAR